MADIVLVTGASRGIGAEVVRLAALRGYSICFSYLSRADLAQALVDELSELGVECKAVQADISVEQDVLSIFEAVDSMQGELRVLVNNAGILHQQSPVESMTLERLQQVCAVNICGTFLCSREAIKRMSFEHGGQGGAIVNVSSGAAVLGSPNEYVDYAATKGAMDTMTVGLSKELAAQGIRVNAVRPGLIYTDIHKSSGEPGRVDRLKSSVPMRRGGTVKEVAEAVMWLASDQASYSTGTFIDVTGGR